MKKISKTIYSIIIISTAILYFGCNDNHMSPSSNGNGTLIRATAIFPTTGTCSSSFITTLSGVNYAFLALGSGGIQILNVMNPSLPEPVSTYNVSGFSEETFSASFNNVPYLFIGAGNGGLAVLNLSNITTPVLDTTFSLSGDYINTVFVDTVHKTLYSGGSFGKLYVFNLSNLPLINNLSTYQSLSYINEIQVSNNVAYLAQDSGMDIVNVTNPAAPVNITFGSSNDYAYDVKISGNLAIVANNANGVVIFDVSNPSNPQRRGIIDTYDIALACTINGNLLYVAEDQSGMEVYDISNPANPRYLAYYTTNSYTENAFYFNGYTYLSDYNDFVVLRYP